MGPETMYVLDGGSDLPWGGGNGRPIVKYRDILRSSMQKTAKSMDMPFGLWVRMGPRNHMSDGSPQLLKDVAMATNFGTQFAITGLKLI